MNYFFVFIYASSVRSAFVSYKAEKGRVNEPAIKEMERPGSLGAR